MPSSIKDYTGLESAERRLAQCTAQLDTDRTDMVDALAALHALKSYAPSMGVSLSEDPDLQTEQTALASVVARYQESLASQKRAQAALDAAQRTEATRAHKAALRKRQLWAQEQNPALFGRLADLEERLHAANSIETHVLYQDIWKLREAVLAEIDCLMAEAPNEETPHAV